MDPVSREAHKAKLLKCMTGFEQLMPQTNAAGGQFLLDAGLRGVDKMHAEGLLDEGERQDWRRRLQVSFCNAHPGVDFGSGSALLKELDVLAAQTDSREELKELTLFATMAFRTLGLETKH